MYGQRFHPLKWYDGVLERVDQPGLLVINSDVHGLVVGGAIEMTTNRPLSSPNGTLSST